MTTKDKALKLALEAMTYADACLKKQLTTKDKHQYAQDLLLEAGTAIREALAEQPAQQEPVALEDVYLTIIQWDVGGGKRSRRELARRIVAKYTPPPQRKPLTDEEIEDIWADCPADWDDKINVLTLARAIEAAHGIKENT